MDQTQAPTLDALAALERRKLHGFGAPGHHHGTAASRDVVKLLGRAVFEADVITPKGLDDRTESGHVLQRAHELAAEAWQADFCRFVTGGSTQSLHAVLAAVAGPGDTVLFATNVHKAERAYALAAGIDAAMVPVMLDQPGTSSTASPRTPSPPRWRRTRRPRRSSSCRPATMA